MFERFMASRRRDRALASLPVGPLRALIEQPTPDLDSPLSELRLLAIDLETTGLDPRKDHLLSVGYVAVDGLSITLGTAGSAVIRADVEVGQSAVVHGLTDDTVAAGQDLEEVLPEVLAALQGRVLLAHFASIEQRFLGAACKRMYGHAPDYVVVDTFELQQRITTAAFRHVREGALRLDTSRAHFGLPRYKAHEALTDALACAELYLAQVTHLGGDGGAEGMTLRQVVS
ncbi:MAG: DNA polymerase III subunit epsilon [Austwickia sp.]|jgi:DNA polymerase III subunit epsilon|nr:DNA polymerase III subunit epsilon [Austwickia sp.]